MKKLLSTTALVAALALPALAQTTTQTTTQPTGPSTGQADLQRQQADGSGFLAERGQADVFASELMGLEVYAVRTHGNTTGDRQLGQTGQQAGQQQTTGQQPGQQQATGQQPGQQQAGQQTNQQGQVTDGLGARAFAAENSDGTNNLHMMNRADLDALDNIGRVEDIVLASNGQVRAIVVGVGGFLGMGQHDVAVTMDQVSFAADAQDSSQIYIVVHTGADLLQNAPAYDRTMPRAQQGGMTGQGGQAGQTGQQTGQAGQTAQAGQTGAATTGTGQADRSPFTAPQMQRDGYQQVMITEVSADMLSGHTCPIPDDHISPRRSALFMTRWVLRSIRAGGRPC